MDLLHILIELSLITTVISDTQDVCMGKSFVAKCQKPDIVVMESAHYGRMETGTCLKHNSDNIGCSNDVLSSVDSLCSGIQECTFTPVVEFAELGEMKQTSCPQDTVSYFKASYTCVSVVEGTRSYCSSHTRVPLSGHEGYISSHVTDQTGCGSPSAPWVIEAREGQTINVSLVDFGALAREPSTATPPCPNPYGFIVEKSNNLNFTVCGLYQRKGQIYQSKSNAVDIHVLSSTRRRTDAKFIIHYIIVGCADLSPPAHAWYTRDGNQATIGCDVTERVWHLECQGNRWKGVVGNCSSPQKETTPDKDGKAYVPPFTILMLGAIIAVTTLLSLMILCVGLCYSRRYRRRHKSNKEQMTALTIYRKSTEVANSHYRPVSTCSSCHGTLPSRDQNRDQAPKASNTEPGYAHIWERPLPDPTHKRAPSSVSEYLTPNNTNDRNNPPGGTADTQKTSLLDEDNISSYYSPETGHKYYVLDQTQM